MTACTRSSTVEGHSHDFLGSLWRDFRAHDYWRLVHGDLSRHHVLEQLPYYHLADEQQRELAERAKERAQQLFDAPIVTEIKPLDIFYEAEPVHQNYYALNPAQGYCTFVVSPKVAKARRAFSQLLR